MRMALHAAMRTSGVPRYWSRQSPNSSSATWLFAGAIFLAASGGALPCLGGVVLLLSHAASAKSRTGAKYPNLNIEAQLGRDEVIWALPPLGSLSGVTTATHQLI